MFKTIANAFKLKDVRKKILITLLLLLVFRIGCWIPAIGFSVQGINDSVKASGFNFFSLMDLVSGGALANQSVLALGVSPYITASIVIQLLTVAVPKLEQLAKSGEDGRRKINLYTRIAALILALAQAIGIVVGYGESAISLDLVGVIPTWIIQAGVVLILVAGGMFTVWLGERITDLGVGNGMSLLIFVGILSSATKSLGGAFKTVFDGNIDFLWVIALFVVAVIAIFAFIVFIDGGERRVSVQYAKQIKGRKMYGGQSTYIPIRVNGSGVMPIIFASALLTLPQLILSFWPNSDAAKWYSQNMGAGTWPYILASSLLILAFAFFYAQISFNADDVSKRIQQQGGFIPGIRAGKPTSDYLRKISNRITLFGAIFLAIIALIPSLAFWAIGTFAQTSAGDIASLINAFSATGLMIVVSVALEFNKQLEAQLIVRNYKGFLD